MGRKITPADYVEHWSSQWNTTTVIAPELDVVLKYNQSQLSNFLNRTGYNRDQYLCAAIAHKLAARNASHAG